MPSLEEIERRIREVMAENEGYHHSPLLDSVSTTFLSLALEYQDLEPFSRLVVMLPKVILGWETSLYLTETDARANLAATTLQELRDRRDSGETIYMPLETGPVQKGDEYIVPLKHGRDDTARIEGLNHGPVVGLLAVLPGEALDQNLLFFLEKYANLATMSVVRRLLIRKNQQHLNFIKNLVADIGHNVILPNIFFKVYLRRLSGKISRLTEIQARLDDLSKAPIQTLPASVRDLSAEIANANEGLLEEFDHIEKHYHNTSLFLETLLRQSHFEEGRYVLQKKTCNFRRDIIYPQVDRFRPRLKERDIEIDLSAGGVPDEQIEAVVDVGLVSQVFSNLLSNAIKYTRPVEWDGRARKVIAYGLELVRDAFGPANDGVKLNLFSSGRPLEATDAERIFSEGYRGSNVENERGTGHGLYFVKEVIDLHGGRVGWEATAKGNNFYFILPK